MAQQSDTKIANIALTHLGESKIDNIDDPDQQRAILCKLRFDDCRDIVLRSHPWSCVTKRVKLSKLLDSEGEPLEPAFGFSYMFQLPSDFLRVLQVDNVSYPYQVEVYTVNKGLSSEATSSPVLLTNASSISIRYVHTPLNLQILTPDISNLIGIRLASELAEPLTSKVDLKQRLEQRYIIELAAARSTDSMQGTPEVVESFTWLNSRGYGLGAQSKSTFFYIDPGSPNTRLDVPTTGVTESPNNVFG